MKKSIFIWLFILGTVKSAHSLMCEPCDAASCPYGIADTLDENGCLACECFLCPQCSCNFGHTGFLENGCPDCSTCLDVPALSCDEITCPFGRGPCFEREECCPLTCKNQALCPNKEVDLILCSKFCPGCILNNCPFAATCQQSCIKVDSSICEDAHCGEGESCQLDNVVCPPQEVCEPKAVCVPNSCEFPISCAMSCPSGLLRDSQNCSLCECRQPTCDERECESGYKCINSTENGQITKCVPAICENAHCGGDFQCRMIDGNPKCVSETCESLACPENSHCVDVPDCTTGPCAKCVTNNDCSSVKCKTDETCTMFTPDCPECECTEGSSPDCTENSPGCDSTCKKPFPQCVAVCDEVQCPENCKYGCLEKPNGCLTTICAPPNDCNDVTCPDGQICSLETPNCDSEAPCPKLRTVCEKYCPPLNCTKKSHKECPWGMKTNSNNCPTCDCNEPYSCDQIKCHTDDRCVTRGNRVDCKSCPKTANTCSAGEEPVIDEYGCITEKCAPADVCEEFDCPIGQECSVVTSPCKPKEKECMGWSPKCVCNQIDCHKYCEHGFKKNLLTGCEMCECNDDLPTCDDIKCPVGKTCTMVPSCMDVNCPLPKPICQDCQTLEPCPACATGEIRVKDERGCETCKCKSLCNDPFCDIECGIIGNKLDDKGCPTCKCNDWKTCEEHKCLDELECIEFEKNEDLHRICRNHDGKKSDVTPIPMSD